jgi:hypothetical protein
MLGFWNELKISEVVLSIIKKGSIIMLPGPEPTGKFFIDIV